MPARRPYASRGVPRRATSRRPGRRPPPGLLLVAVLVVAALGAGWALSPLRPGATWSGSAPANLADQQFAQPPAELAAAAMPTEDATAGANGSVQAKAAPLLRPWETASAHGILADPDLMARLDPAVAGIDGEIGIVVKDLGSGRGAVLNGNMELQSASLYKLPVLFTVFDLGLNMSEELTITDEALSYDAGTMELTAGETLSVAEALERMITLSDNTSAILLSSRVGAARIIANISALGMATTHYSLERMTTSALDMASLMQLIADGKAVSPAASADMLHLLLRQRVNDRLPRLLPDDIQVAHKTGNLPGVVNDVGVLYGPTSTVLVAGLVSDTSDETAAATAIAQVGQIASAYFEQQSEVLDRPRIPPAPLRPIPPVVRESHPLPTLTPTLVARIQPSPPPTATVAATAPQATAVPPAPSPTRPTVAIAQTATLKPTPPLPAATATRVPPPATATPMPPPTRAPTVRPAPAGTATQVGPARR